MDPQKFLADRIDVLSRIIKGDATPNEVVDNAILVAPGGIPGKAAYKTGHQMLKSAGTPGQSRMSGLGIAGDAPIYDTPFNQELPVNSLGLNNIVRDPTLGSYEARVQ